MREGAKQVIGTFLNVFLCISNFASSLMPAEEDDGESFDVFHFQTESQAF